MLLPGMTLGLLVVLLVVAALWDIRKRRIPNALSAAVALFGLGSVLVREGWWSVLSGSAAMLLTVAVLWVPWLKGRIGGGDVKLAAAAATAVGLRFLFEYLLATALAGALVAVICYGLSARSARKEMVTNLKLVAAGVMPDAPLHGGAGRMSVPYGAACAAAALLVVFLRKGW